MPKEMTAPSDLRTDRATLRAPKKLNDGSLRVEAVVATVGEVLDYGNRKEVVTKESLSDPVYLDSSRGSGISRHHVRGANGRDREMTVKDKGQRVGTVTGTRFDESEGVAIREMAIFDKATIDDILSKRLTYISDTYYVTQERVNADGQIEQVKRLSNSTAITNNPRAKSASIRTDEADMTPEEIQALIAGAVGPLSTQIADLTTKLEEATKEPEVVVHVDSADDIAERIVAVRLRADSLDVEIPDDIKGEIDLAKHVAVKLGADAARCDSADFCHGFIAASKVVEAPKREGWNPSTTKTEPTKSAV